MPLDSTPSVRTWPARIAIAACAAAALAAAALLARHAAQYFFLFDDFPLNGQASRWPLREIVGTPLFGFYRPGFFLWLRGTHALFGWHTPSGYAALAVLVHAANAALVARLAGSMLGRTEGRWFAATLFFLSPWSAEAVFWVSGGFDLLATGSVLVALIAGLAWSEARCRRPIGWGLVGVAASLAALFTKESAVVLPALFGLVWLASAASQTPGTYAWRRGVAMASAMVALVTLYLAMRTRVVASLTGGAYGGWFDLVAAGDVLANLGSHARAALVWPAPHDHTLRAIGPLAVLGPLSALSLAGLALAGMSLRPRSGLLLAAAAVASLLPVLWVGLHPGTSGGGRVLYLAGVPFTLLGGLGLERLSAAPDGWRGPLGAIAAGLVLVAATLSLDGQRAIWAQACRLSRAAVDAYRPFVGQTQPIHIDNLPFWFTEGPYVIKSYAFAYYFHPAVSPPTSGTALELVSIDGRVTVTNRWPEPGAGLPPPGARPVALAIELR